MAADAGGPGFPRPFGNYILLMAFARGGMGEVYLAKRGAILGAEKYCVLKKLRPELTEDREYVARFIDEARVVVQLNHANICQVFDVGRVGTEYYLAMEYVSGRDVRSLQDRAREREARIAEPSVLYLAAQTLSALDYAHRRTHPMTGELLNLVHRDVSPQNIMVSYEGEVKLIDFGLASSRLKVERTQPNIVMGKMAYMAPEQARGEGIDARADLFAAGVVTYELLAGERFYEGMSSQEIWYVVGRGGFVPKKWNELSDDIARILARALHPDPSLRFANCAEFRDALMGYLHTRHPGTGERALRDLVHSLYNDEIHREREMLLGFAEVSGEVLDDLIESTRSQSVSLAYAGETSQGGARIVHDERTHAGRGGGSTSGSSTALAELASDVSSAEGSIADDPTMLGGQAVAESSSSSSTSSPSLPSAPALAGDPPRTPPTGTMAPSGPVHASVAHDDTLLAPSSDRTQPQARANDITFVVPRPAVPTVPVRALEGERRVGVRLLVVAAALVVVGAGVFFAVTPDGVSPADVSPDDVSPGHVSSDHVSSGHAAAVALEARASADAPPPVPPDPGVVDDKPPVVALETKPAAAETALPAPEPLPTEPPPQEQAATATTKAEEASPTTSERRERRRRSGKAVVDKARPEPRPSPPAPAPAPAPVIPKADLKTMVRRVAEECGLNGTCAKPAIYGRWVNYGAADAGTKKAFERDVERCYRSCMLR